MKDQYDEEYFERGVITGKSGYQNYSWLPDMTIPLAFSYIDYLNIKKEHTILDFGCAKGYTVKALRLLHRQAWGCDISNYAVNSSDSCTREHLRVASEVNLVPFDCNFDFIIAKDIFEHVPEEEIDHLLSGLSLKGDKLFAVIPLGKDDKFVIPSYELDVTHVLKKDKDWWVDRLEKNCWIIKDFNYLIKGIKDNYNNFEKGNGFFYLEKKS